MATKQQKASDELRQNILDVAARHFKENGYENTTIKMIANDLHVAPGTILYHFKNKVWILHDLFDNYFIVLDEYIRITLQEGFNYYLYYSIMSIYVNQALIENERILELFYNKDHADIWKHQRVPSYEDQYRLISDDFNKDFTNAELRLAAIMDIGARTHLHKELVDGDGTISKENYSYCHAYLMGVFARLDEATIKKNLKRAFEFVGAHPAPSMALFD
jgi:AcrR family transcriptional regulator